MENGYWKYWGKARKEGEAGTPYHLLPYHSLDVAAVGKVFLKRHPRLAEQLANDLAMPLRLFVQWLTFCLAMHDLGKFAISFQGLEQELHEKLTGQTERKDYALRHDSLGFLFWHEYLLGKFSDAGFLGMEPKSRAFRQGKEWFFDRWMKLVTGHHGEPPNICNGDHNWRTDAFFAEDDLAAAECFWQDCLTLLAPDATQLAKLLENRDFAKAIQPHSWRLAGLAVLCDWIGSNREIFHYCSEKTDLDHYWRKYALPRAEEALLRAAVLPAKVAHYAGIEPLFPYIDNATPLQRFCHEHILEAEPQLLILEDVTGAGKTEAALILTQRLMALGLADGFYIGLPTMATANAMYERMAECYRKLYEPDERPSLVLAHSARHLSKLFHDSILNQANDGLNYSGQPGASAQCAAWLADNSKKALLADAGIGTLDQALLTVLPARHQSLRLYGLSRKVLVVDEVHAYDVYMHRLLQTVLQGHARMGGSAILLSATLPSKMRQELVDAFQEGLKGDFQTVSTQSPYPLVTHLTRQKLSESRIKTRSEVRRAIKLEFLDRESQVIDLIKSAADEGRCVCWIRNTVDDVRKSFYNLSETAGIDTNRLSQFHSRFALKDRLDREEQVLGWFGTKSKSEDRSGRILVASQVIQESLDVDLDSIISDLAPVDLLIQRAGRLHRHRRDLNGKRLPQGQLKDLRPRPVFYIHAPSFTEAPKSDWYRAAFPKACWVYPNTAQLWLTHKALRVNGLLRMPKDARRLIEYVYDGISSFPETLSDSDLKVDGEKKAKVSQADFNALNLDEGYTHSGLWDEEVRIPTRLGDEQKTVYLAYIENGELRPLYSGDFPWDLSSVKLPERCIGGVALDAEHQRMVDDLKQRNVKFHASDLILPLESDEQGGWRGRVQDKTGNSVDISYDSMQGFIFKGN
ncbi:CRISPR-associated helicase Cas3' [Methylocaldum sp. GT1BB]|jgi:CRISPR-associated endonuclease/helicase Cas3|uniref:CRISPR-associated helicase Cas3' n=1 Tax=Methylocaldum sp. GT1BB TaxID=3438963 RepID=UPI003DA0E21F